MEKNALMLYLISSLIQFICETQEVKYFLWFTTILILSCLVISEEIIKLWLGRFLLRVKIMGSV